MERNVPNCSLSQVRRETKICLLKMQTLGPTRDLLNQNLLFNKVLGKFIYRINLKSTKILDIGCEILIRWKAALKPLEELKYRWPRSVTANIQNQILQGQGIQL